MEAIYTGQKCILCNESHKYFCIKCSHSLTVNKLTAISSSRRPTEPRSTHTVTTNYRIGIKEEEEGLLAS